MSAHGISANSERIDFDRFADCPICGAAEGKQCFSTNGTRKRIACAARPYRLDAMREKFAELEAGIEVVRLEMQSLQRMILKQQTQIDLLLGEVES